MLFPTWYLYLLALAGIAIAIVGLAVAKKRVAIRYVGLAVGGIVVLVSMYLYVSTSRAIVIAGSRGHVTIEHVAVYGTPKVTNIVAKTADPSLTRSWIINKTTDVELEVRLAFYTKSGRDTLGGSSPTPTIPPDTAFAYDEAIDYIGPDDPPPKKLESEFEMDGKYWLTW